MVDATILGNCREDDFSGRALKNSTGNVTEAELLRLLMRGDGLQDALTKRLQNGLRSSVIRERHSRKLQLLFQVFAPNGNADTGIPRVNPSTGAIVEKHKVQDKQIPHSIVGYADWLYSRRNSIVHGAGTNRFLDNDRVQIKNHYKIDLKKTFKISVGSIMIAQVYYLNVAKILKCEA